MRIFKVSIIAGILLFAGCSSSASEQPEVAQTAEDIATQLQQEQQWQASHESSQELACMVYHAANPASDNEMITKLMEGEPMMPLSVAEAVVRILEREC